MVANEDLAICTACGTQYDLPYTHPPSACRICDDPRQYVPPQGQTWTSLTQLRKAKHTNIFTPDAVDSRITSISTEPRFGIGQRCILLETPAGNILWDCIAFLDAATTERIRAKGGLNAIVISHPHFYTTHLLWARTFGCPVYVAAEDVGWVNARDEEGDRRRVIEGDSEEIVPGVRAIKLGGHFPGSLVLLWEEKLFVADTMHPVASAHYFVDRPPGTNSFAFMWSYPNMIPLSPQVMHQMWQRLKPYEFTSAHGIVLGSDVRDPNVKRRVLESMKIATEAQGHTDVAILKETWP